jgi:hypothetical protein
MTPGKLSSHTAEAPFCSGGRPDLSPTAREEPIVLIITSAVQVILRQAGWPSGLRYPTAAVEFQLHHDCGAVA